MAFRPWLASVFVFSYVESFGNFWNQFAIRFSCSEAQCSGQIVEVCRCVVSSCCVKHGAAWHSGSFQVVRSWPLKTWLKTLPSAATWQPAAAWLDRLAPQTRCGGCSVARSVVYTQTTNKQGRSGEAQTVYDTRAFVVPFDRLRSLIHPARSLFWFPSRWVKHTEWRVNEAKPTQCS